MSQPGRGALLAVVATAGLVFASTAGASIGGAAPSTADPAAALAAASAPSGRDTAPALVASAADAPTGPTPQAECGPGSRPETGIQGRVPAADVEAGRVAEGFRCNIEVVGQQGPSGGYKVERFVDAAGHECAYYDTTLLFPSNATNLSEGPTGVAVLDMSDPANPVQTDTLVTPAMQTPHESLLLNQERGLLAAVAGNPLFAPGQVDVYDVNTDCRHPELTSSLPVGILGHESGFAPDGNTFYAASLGGGLLTAIDLTDPSRPVTLYTGRHDTHSLSISDDGNRAYLASGAGFPRNAAGLGAEVNGLVILDVSEIQARKPNPQTRVISTLTWPNVTIPQATLPVTIGGKDYLVEVDEFATTEQMRISANGPRVGAGRIIDISDETNPRLVSNLRLAVHEEQNRAELAGDPGTGSATGGYAGHYCAVPRRVEPGIVACSFLASGLRVFDIRDPEAPREVAYFVGPVPPGGEANAAFSSATFVPERREIWYSDGDRGFLALRLSPAAWPGAGEALSGAPPPAQAGPPTTAAAPAAVAPPSAAGTTVTSARSRLPATGAAVPLVAALGLLTAAVAVRRLAGRPG